MRALAYRAPLGLGYMYVADGLLATSARTTVDFALMAKINALYCKWNVQQTHLLFVWRFQLIVVGLFDCTEFLAKRSIVSLIPYLFKIAYCV